MSFRDGNSMIPTDREFDRYTADHCDRCECVITGEHEENSKGEWFCPDCWENHEREADEERIAEENFEREQAALETPTSSTTT